MNLVGCGDAAFPAAARTDRPELAKVVRRLDAGDVLVVTRLTPRPPPRARWRGDAKPLVAPSFDPIIVDRFRGYRDALRARTRGRNIVRGLAIYFGGWVHDNDPRSDCIRLVGRVVGWNCIFVPGLNRTDWHVIQLVEVENYYLIIDNDDAILR
jgi:hypothetical protein